MSPPCFEFGQTGRCRFGERCRYSHGAGFDPRKYTKYTFDDQQPDPADERAQQRSALAEAMALVRAAKAKAGGPAPAPAPEAPGGITFIPRRGGAAARKHAHCPRRL